MTGTKLLYVLRLNHGTSARYSNMITREGFKIPDKQRVDHWLGNGLYFFREDRVQALTWAIYKFRDYNVREVHVLETVIEVEEERFLNLDSRGGMNTLDKLIAELKQRFPSTCFKFESKEQYRCFLMDTLPRKFAVIQRTFKGDSAFDKKEEFVEAGLHLQGVQVCVRDIKAITGNNTSIVKRRRLSQARSG